MTEKETEGLALLKHYASDADGKAILTKFSESIQVANRFERKHWMPTVRKMNGWTVNLRHGTTYAITLRRDEIEILLMPGILNDDEREALDNAAHEMPFEPSWGPRRFRLDWAGASKLWESIEKAHHEVSQSPEIRFRRGEPRGRRPDRFPEPGT